MPGKLETYDVESDAIGARDHYNHNLGRRATVFQVPGASCTDFGGGGFDDIFKPDQNLPKWILVVEDLN